MHLVYCLRHCSGGPVSSHIISRDTGGYIYIRLVCVNKPTYKLGPGMNHSSSENGWRQLASFPFSNDLLHVRIASDNRLIRLLLMCWFATIARSSSRLFIDFGRFNRVQWNSCSAESYRSVKIASHWTARTHANTHAQTDERFENVMPPADRRMSDGGKQNKTRTD